MVKVIVAEIDMEGGGVTISGTRSETRLDLLDRGPLDGAGRE